MSYYIVQYDRNFEKRVANEVAVFYSFNHFY